MGRRLRERKKKSEVKQRGPGRPKNENIPAPEVNEKGEAFYRCKECDATVKTYNALIGILYTLFIFFVRKWYVVNRFLVLAYLYDFD